MKNTMPLEYAKKACEYVKENPLELVGLALGFLGLRK